MLEAMISSGMGGSQPYPDTGPPGQVLFAGKGNYSWIVPAGIYSICFVVVGAGEAGITEGAGKAGGGLRYVNNFPVVPGKQHSIVIGDNMTVIAYDATDLVKEPPRRSSAFGIVASRGSYGTPFSNTVKGGIGSTLRGDGDNNGGGKSGNFTNGAVDPGRGPTFGIGGAGINVMTGAMVSPAGGAGAAYGGGAGWGNFAGGAGCVRIIWGAGRAFPSTKITNV